MDRSVRESQTPRQAIASACVQRGQSAVVAGCVDLLTGGRADAELIYALGGAPARWAVTGESPGPDYWLRVWAARGLFWAWDDVAFSAIVRALNDEAWRVREMAAKVVRRHLVGDALEVVAELINDPNPRVRAAADQAIVRLVSCGA